MLQVAILIRRMRSVSCALAMMALVCSLTTAAQTNPPQDSSAQQQAAPLPTETQAVHILVGHSIIINTQARLRRIVVGNPNAVESTTLSPTELVITAKAAGSSSVVIWDENGQSRILEVSADIDVSGLREAIQRTFPAEKVQVEAEEGKLVLTGVVSSPAIAEQLGKMATAYAKEFVNSVVVAEPGRQKQVLLKVRFAEVDRAKLDDFGFNLLSTGAAKTIGTVTTGQFSPPGLTGGQLTSTVPPPKSFTTQQSISDLLNIFIFRPDINLGATIRDLQAKNVLQILAEPNLMAMGGETAKFLAGGEFPYAVVQSTAGGVPTITVQFRPFGVRLDFTGVIESDGIIRLKVAPEVSSLDYANAVRISGFTLPAISTRRAETSVELKDGQSFGIAGLLDQRTTALFSKVPGIADVPVLGQLFRSRSLNRSKSELVVLVTPEIVDPLAAPAAPATPKMPVSNLDTDQFDKGLPKGAAKR